MPLFASDLAAGTGRDATRKAEADQDDGHEELELRRRVKERKRGEDRIVRAIVCRLPRKDNGGMTQ